ncbi:MAG: serine protease [Verrucomicrobia bacterium]|nr:serine protease [Verrucomicrobiota bacterium]
MAETVWYESVEKLTPYVVRIWTPQGSGTGFIVSKSKNTPLCAVATADHVISHAHYWEEPIRVEHIASGKTLFLRKDDRAINTDSQTDTAAIIFERKEIVLPTDDVPLTPKDKYFKPGVEIGWLGFPAIQQASLCFFSGRISAWIEKDGAYLVDGVAINGVSGGPAFLGSMLVGVVSAYIPNRATGEPLPGLAVVRSVNRYHQITQEFETLDQAKAKETPPTEPPPPKTEAPTQPK